MAKGNMAAVSERERMCRSKFEGFFEKTKNNFPFLLLRMFFYVLGEWEARQMREGGERREEMVELAAVVDRRDILVFSLVLFAFLCI
jgi:hypothetical protein